MKKIILVVMIALGFVAAKAQAPKAQWITIKSSNLRCYDCQVMLEQYLKRANASQMEMGMIQYKFNLMQGTVRIQYWPDRTNPSFIKTTIANAGFDADEVKATEDSYKLLPPICKRAEDGGGPKKGQPCHMPKD
jgi:hypothetical protein